MIEPMPASRRSAAALGLALTLTLSLTLSLSSSCGKSRQEKPRESEPAAPMGAKRPAPPRARVVHSPRQGPIFTVPKRPPGAPSAGDLLAFGQSAPTLLDWRKSPVWSELAESQFRLPPKARKVTAQILAKGWGAAAKAPETRALLKHLAAHRTLLDRAAKTPPCAALRKSWLHTKLLQQHRSLFPLKMLTEALLLRARLHQHHKRTGPALEAALAALRLSCHLAQIPEVIIQLMALRLEQQGVAVLVAQPVAPPACLRRMRALVQHVTRRPRLDHVARADWLMARSQLHLITRDLTKLGQTGADQRTRKRLATLKQLILGRASALFGQYSQRMRQGLATGRLADWETLDRFLLEHKAALEGLQKKHGVKSGAALSWAAARSPNKHPSWTADIIARTFLGMVTMRSTIWRRARELHRANRRALDELRIKGCAKP